MSVLMSMVWVERILGPRFLRPPRVGGKLLEEYHRRVTIRVECYAGYRGDQEPRAFWCGARRLEVRDITDRWYAPAQRWFKVDADDGNVYVLRHDETTGDWDIAAYRANG